MKTVLNITNKLSVLIEVFDSLIISKQKFKKIG